MVISPVRTTQVVLACVITRAPFNRVSLRRLHISGFRGGAGRGVEDQILGQIHPGTTGDGEPVLRPLAATPVPPAASEFPVLLERWRNERGWTKADLAKRAGVDPSSVTRFEQGARAPERATVLQLADAMALPLVDRDRLLAAAGFRSELWDDPQLIALAHALHDDRLPDAVRGQVRSLIEMAISYCQQRQQPPFAPVAGAGTW